MNKMNEFDKLKDNLYDLWSKMERGKINLEYSVDTLCAMAKYYENRINKGWNLDYQLPSSDRKKLLYFLVYLFFLF